MQNGVKLFIRSKEKGKFLFMLRDDKPNISNPNKWSLIGGGIDDGESPEEAVRREGKEEIGLENFEIEKITEKNHIHDDGIKKFKNIVYLFKTVIEENKVGELTEGQRIDWFSLDKILGKDLVDIVREVILEEREKLVK